MRRIAETKTRRLLRILLLWHGALSADADDRGLLWRTQIRVTEPAAKPVAVAQEPQRAADWTRQPVGAVVGWVLSIAAGSSGNLLPTMASGNLLLALLIYLPERMFGEYASR